MRGSHGLCRARLVLLPAVVQLWWPVVRAWLVVRP